MGRGDELPDLDDDDTDDLVQERGETKMCWSTRGKKNKKKKKKRKDGEEDGEKKSKKKSAKAKKDDASAAPTKGTFSLEYATSGRAKCKGKDIQCGGLMLMVILTDTSLHFNRLWW